jgi:hypothetical protein
MIPKERKAEEKIEMDQKEALDMFNRYYNTRLKCLYDHCNKQKGTKTYDPNVVFEHWKKIYPAVEKKDKDLEFESDENAKKLIDGWMKWHIKDEQERRDRLKHEQMEQLKQQILKESQKKMDEEKKKPVEYNKDGKPMTLKELEQKKQKDHMEKICKPKERLIRGKTVVELKSKFPQDRILGQMLVDEFANDRIVKRPLEYDNVDSEEEDAIKRRYAKKGAKGKKGKRAKSADRDHKNKKDWVTETQKEAKRQKELMSRFNELSKKYNIEKDAELRNDKKEDDDLKKQREKFDIFMQSKVLQYRKLMHSKQNVEVPTETQYLSDVIIH